MTQEAQDAVGDYKYGFHDPESSTIRFDKGLSETKTLQSVEDTVKRSGHDFSIINLGFNIFRTTLTLKFNNHEISYILGFFRIVRVCVSLQILQLQLGPTV